jgi:type VI protein secretion system component VasK
MRLAGAGMAAKMALRRVVMRFAIAAALGVCALIALIGAVGYALASLYYKLTYSMSEPQAALILTGILVALALILAGIAFLVLRQPKRKPDGLAELARRASQGISGRRSIDARGLLEKLPVTPTTVLGALALGIIIGVLRRRPRR